MPVPARVSLVTLGVADVAASTAFYQALGWPLSPASVPDEVSFFETAGGLLAVWRRDALTADAGLDPTAGNGSPLVALAMNLDSPGQVDEAFDEIRRAGGTIRKAPMATPWGGYSGYFADPDGHLWEVAHNPAWPVGEDGRPSLPKA